MTMDELIQLMREVKLQQIRKQIRFDRRPNAYKYMDYPGGKWLDRSQIIEEFFTEAKRRKP